MKLPAIPSLQGLSPALVRVLAPLKKIAESITEDFEAEATRQVELITAAGTGTPGYDGSLDTTPPPNVANFAAHGTFSSILLTWDLPTITNGYFNHLQTRIYVADTDVGYPSAIPAGTSGGSSFVDPDLARGATKYYWAVHESKAGVDSVSAAGAVSATTVPVTITETADSFSPVQIHTDVSLPASGTEGDILYWTVDLSLYRYNGADWVNWINGDDDITPDTVPSGAISAGAVAGDHIEVGAITAASAIIDDLAVTGSMIADTVLVESMFSTTTKITGAKIANAQVVSGKIADAAITNITMGSVIIDKAKVFSLDVNTFDGDKNTMASTTWTGTTALTNTWAQISTSMTLPASTHIDGHKPTYIATGLWSGSAGATVAFGIKDSSPAFIGYGYGVYPSNGQWFATFQCDEPNTTAAKTITFWAKWTADPLSLGVNLYQFTVIQMGIR